MLQCLGDGVDLVAYAPVHGLNLGARLQVDHAVGKEVETVLAYLVGVVPVLEHRLRVEVIPYLVEVLDQLVVGFLGLELLGHLGQRGHAEDVDDQHRVVGRKRASALGDDVGMGDVVAVGDVDEGIDAVVDILLNGVVDRALRVGRPAAVVVDAQSAAAVDELNVVAHLAEVDVELSGLGEGVLYAADLIDLRTDVEMDEPDAVVQSVAVELIEGLEQFRWGQSELRRVAAALGPFA